jgi:hypothetical protein
MLPDAAAADAFRAGQIALATASMHAPTAITARPMDIPPPLFGLVLRLYRPLLDAWHNAAVVFPRCGSGNHRRYLRFESLSDSADHRSIPPSAVTLENQRLSKYSLLAPAINTPPMFGSRELMDGTDNDDRFAKAFGYAESPSISVRPEMLRHRPATAPLAVDATIIVAGRWVRAARKIVDRGMSCTIDT